MKVEERHHECQQAPTHQANKSSKNRTWRGCSVAPREPFASSVVFKQNGLCLNKLSIQGSHDRSSTGTSHHSLPSEEIPLSAPHSIGNERKYITLLYIEWHDILCMANWNAKSMDKCSKTLKKHFARSSSQAIAFKLWWAAAQQMQDIWHMRTKRTSSCTVCYEFH